MMSKANTIVGAIGCAVGYSIAQWILRDPVEGAVLYGIFLLALALVVADIVRDFLFERVWPWIRP